MVCQGREIVYTVAIGEIERNFDFEFNIWVQS